ncbi:MAG: family 20 glycosylhydrolase [Paramuribaculum sp.]|nr:family 20 glycosylhydrolase [Paramuribaculum sp.]
MLKKFFFVALAVFIAHNASINGQLNSSVTPLPVSITEGKGEFTITSSTPLNINAPQPDKERLLKYASENLQGYSGKTGNAGKTPAISLNIVKSIDGTDSPEGYRLVSDPKGIVIEATGAAGLFYGLQTLIQLADETNKVPAVTITDYPRLEYRGMMLDISRHFRDKEFIKKQIDAIAKLKLNKLHLHLTDAAGWRIEIKKYPRLTEYAAWRPEETWKEWNDGGNRYIEGSNPLAHGGYLTQEDAREIVEYAADRYITVIPEIEMPSHSEEVTATFPELSCTHGKQPDVCVGNEKTFEFFENVLDEIIDIFPSEYIHIGGDEASKQAWKECELCLARMEKENLKNVDELQSYMIERMEKYLNSKGREIIGWDEIMEGGLAPNATVMSWRGTEGGIKAAESGHKAIMAPGGYCYLDSYQDAPATQPEAISGYTPLSRVYSYNPVPDTLSADIQKYITGIQGNLWCEYVPTAQHAEYMLYPRMIAISEIGWTPQELRDWDNFYPRALKVNDRMQREGYHVFDLRGEVGNRREAVLGTDHLGKGKKVTYNVPWWGRYNANFDSTLTDGERGGWSYGDGKWQGFLYRGNQRVDVTIDLEKEEEISYIGADFMQIIGPGVWLPAKVVISVSDDGENFRELATIEHEQKATSGLSFKTYAWEGKTKARYVRYVANSTEGCQFTDEIVIR